MRRAHADTEILSRLVKWAAMCGRFTLQLDGDELLHAYDSTGDGRAGEWEPIYSIAPRTKASVVREFMDDGGAAQRRLGLAR